MFQSNHQKLQDDLQVVGLKIKHHEDNIKYLESQKKSLDDSILDMQVILGKYHTSKSYVMKDEGHSREQSGDETVENILKNEKSAAGILYKLETTHEVQASQLPLIKDILGVVATLGKVDDDNLSRLLSEYLGLETMLSVVCKTSDGVKSLEIYDEGGSIVKASGLHGLGASMGRILEGRFRVICLENLRPYRGKFLADDPQRRLDLIRPNLPNGNPPPGFLGFAVNVINLDCANLISVTSNGDGLRETLFYSLFSHLQLYRTRAEMLQALPCISHGALSLDGGMIRNSGVFFLGTRQGSGVKFSEIFGRPSLPENYYVTENRMKELKWEKDRILEDIQREHALLDQARFNYEIKKQEFLKFLAQGSQYLTQAKFDTRS